MMTVTKLARSCGLSRSTVLYYESIGLLQPKLRSEGNYRCYGEQEAARLRQIRVYRDAGLRMEDIRALLERPDTGAEAVLQRRFAEIGAEIEALRGHQRAIARLLRQPRSFDVIDKDKWVSIMKGAGFSEAEMRRWHEEFERAAPQEHQEFLEFLHIPAPEITGIRAWSRGEKRP
jgi:MerR family transcriptional regulator, thiopeptide resistance regulator